MKKILLFAIAFVMLFSLTACKGKENTEITNQAKQTYLDNYLKPDSPKATINDVSFWPFLGIYNDSLVAVFYGGKYHGEFTDYIVELEIEGLDFSYSNGYPILIWNNNNIISLAEAFQQELFTKDNLSMIYKLYRNISD